MEIVLKIVTVKTVVILLAVVIVLTVVTVVTVAKKVSTTAVVKLFFSCYCKIKGEKIRSV